MVLRQDKLEQARKLLEEMVNEVASRGPIRVRIGPALAALAALESGQPAAAPTEPVKKEPAEVPPPAKPETAPRPAATADNIRIPTEKLDDVLNTASEVFISRIRLASDVAATVPKARRELLRELQRRA